VKGNQRTMQAPPKTLGDAVKRLVSILDKETMETFAGRSDVILEALWESLRQMCRRPW